MSDRAREQKLVDIMFQIGLTIHIERDAFANYGREDVAKWIAEQLKGCGFETIPCGTSWGVLIDR